MTDDSWLDLEFMAELLNEIVSQVLKQYRVDAETARAWIREVWARDAALRAAAQRAGNADQLRRLAVFKAATVAAKKQIYYALRRYRPGSDSGVSLDAPHGETSGEPATDRAARLRQIVQTHRSTAERLPHQNAFYAALFEHLSGVTSILDVGCGVQPLLFPFSGLGSAVQCYLALDKDAEAIDALQELADERLIAMRHHLGRDRFDLPDGCPARFDVAFLFKLVPILQRQDREALGVLNDLPADRWIVTGSRLALAKHRRIERRERADIEQFLRDAGRTIRGEFLVGEEFGYIAE